MAAYTAQQAVASQLGRDLDIVCHTLLQCALVHGTSLRYAPTSAGQLAARCTASASRPASH